MSSLSTKKSFHEAEIFQQFTYDKIYVKRKEIERHLPGYYS